MKYINIGNILGLLVPDNYRVKKEEEAIIIHGNAGEMRLFLFQELNGNKDEWCYDHLENHIKNVVGPPFTTNVDKIDGDSWGGYQAVTKMSDTAYLVNRVIGSKCSEFGVRIEFEALIDSMPEELLEVIESIGFNVEQ